MLNHRPTSQKQVPLGMCGPALGTIKVGHRSSHGLRTTKTWAWMTGTVGINPGCRMRGPTQVHQRKYPHLVPPEHQRPTSISQRSIRHSIHLRAALRVLSHLLLFSLFRFHPSIMAPSRRFQGTPFQDVHTHLCNKHTVPVRLLPWVHTSSRRGPNPPRFLPVKLCLLTLKHNRPAHHPPLDQGEALRKCGTGQGRDETPRKRTVLSSHRFLGLDIPRSDSHSTFHVLGFFCCYRLNQVTAASSLLLLCSSIPRNCILTTPIYNLAVIALQLFVLHGVFFSRSIMS